MTGDPRPTLPVGLKDDFPVLRQLVHGRPIVYLDSGNTSQKPQSVIDAMTHYYEVDNANVHRGSYELAVRATAAIEGARAKVARFINAPSASEVIFTKNATEAMNLIARSWGGANLGPMGIGVLWAPAEILDELDALEVEIQDGLKRLREMLA